MCISVPFIWIRAFYDQDYLCDTRKINRVDVGAGNVMTNLCCFFYHNPLWNVQKILSIRIKNFFKKKVKGYRINLKKKSVFGHNSEIIICTNNEIFFVNFFFLILNNKVINTMKINKWKTYMPGSFKILIFKRIDLII